MLLEERVQSVTEAQAVELARELYGLAVTAKSLPGEYDDNFHLTKTENTDVGAEPPSEPRSAASFVLKVMHPARERSFLDLQCRALQHLAEFAPGIVLPRVCAAPGGESFTEVSASDGSRRLVWLLTYAPGKILAEARPHSEELLASVGRLLGEIDVALADFAHPGAHRELKWDFAKARWIREHLSLIADAWRRALVEKVLTRYEAEVVPAMPWLRRSVVYGDANDHNVLVGEPWPVPRQAVSVIDFGDLHYSFTVSEPAIAAAYAILGKTDPLRAAAAVVRGYHGAFPLTEAEIAVLYALIGTRLAVSVVNSAQRATLKPGDPYVIVSEAPAWEALERLAQVHPRFAHYTFRDACGLSPVPHNAAVQKWLAASARSAASPLDVNLRTAPSVFFDLSVGSAAVGSDPAEMDCERATERIFAELKKARASIGLGRYNEARLCYTSPQFGASTNPTEDRRTIHLGIDIFAAPGSAVYAPLEGTVHALANNTAALDYGPVVILRHVAGQGAGKRADKAAVEGQELFTLYGHLSRDTLRNLRVGQMIARGEKFARIGAAPENGGWPPHLHFQVIVDLLDRGTDFPGVAFASQRAVWTSLSPDPNLLLGIPPARFGENEPSPAETLAARRSVLGRNLSVSYREPAKIVRGWMQYLYDESGRAFLDVYNNVPLVGHSHPRVVRAAQEQLALLNTNTRYLHDHVVRYAERLTRLLPEPLRVCYFVNSGSEANELALRMARAHTGREDVIVLEHAYHGNTNALIEISPYKFNGPGGRGNRPWVHVAPIADDYRGAYRREDPDAGTKYARKVSEIIEGVHGEGREVAAFIAETWPSVAGQIVFPPGYLVEAYRLVREAGGVCIADEVQVGFGRLGTHFWGFETQGAVPDIVVMGKPIGNGFPLAAVVTTPEVAAAFANGMEFFSTFGGNPVACAAGLAVLDVVRDEKLQQRALRVGNYWTGKLQALQQRFALIGDVRGSGLFLGIDLVRDSATREPATEQADYVVNRLRERGILAGSDGPHDNVIKLRPPLIFSEADADLFCETLAAILEEDAAQPAARVRARPEAAAPASLHATP
jgi:4-aminobutyrate aminotransferase-like enzyme/Ser/Thr protein kinase RdoA (MazF antagonist)